jgi:intraflagellar transport protein 140
LNTRSYLSKARNTPAATKQERLAVLQQRIMLVERFVQARKLIKDDPSETVQICTQLLSSQSRIDNAIRVGDVFALLIEYYYKISDYQKAFGLIEQMRDRNIILSPYLDQTMTDTIFKEVGESAESMRGGKEPSSEDRSSAVNGGEIGEEIPDEIGGEIGSDFSGSGSDDDYMSSSKK